MGTVLFVFPRGVHKDKTALKTHIADIEQVMGVLKDG